MDINRIGPREALSNSIWLDLNNSGWDSDVLDKVTEERLNVFENLTDTQIEAISGLLITAHVAARKDALKQSISALKSL